MNNRITIKINPLSHYSKYVSSDYILCGVDFEINLDGTIHQFRSESSDNCIKLLLSEIEAYLSGELSEPAELFYYIPWICGNHCVYPYSFKVNSSKSWTFRYKRNEMNTEFDFECDISKDDIVSMQNQIKDQFAKIDWESLGKTPLYTFEFPEKNFEWCYSAKELCNSLSNLCVGKRIKAIYVGATNYAEPLAVRENYVNYHLGTEVIIQLDTLLLDLLIRAEGLLEWRVFENSEYSLVGPTLKFIENGHKEYSNIGDVYGAFKNDYTDTISKVSVFETDRWPWSPEGFDKSKLGDPVELPGTLAFYLSNNYGLFFWGLDDDFAIKLFNVDNEN